MLLMYNCVSGILLGSSVFLAVPGSIFFHHLQDSLILACFLHPHSHISLLHCSHYMSWQRCHDYHPHLTSCHSYNHLHNDPASTLETPNISFIFLDLFLVFLMFLFLILQVPTISLLVPKFSTMVVPSFEVLSFTPFPNVFALIVTTLHIQGQFIFRPTMFPLELQVSLLKPFLDFINGYQC